MRDIWIGLCLAAALLGGLFYAASHRAHPVPMIAGRPVDQKVIKAAAASIDKGFVGIRQVGAWTVICAAKPLIVGGKPAAETSAPLPLEPGAKAPTSTPPESEAGLGASKGSAKAVTRAVSLGRCRSLLEFRRKEDPKKIAIAVIFRVIGPAPGKLALFVRIPAGKPGGKVGLHVGNVTLEIPINGCADAGCMAVGILAPATATVLAAEARAELVLPPAKDSSRKAVPLPLVGLAASLSALRRAES